MSEASWSAFSTARCRTETASSAFVESLEVSAARLDTGFAD